MAQDNPAVANSQAEADDTEAADRLRFNEQAALMLNIDNILNSTAAGELVPTAGGRRFRTYINFGKYKPSNGGSDGHVGLTKSLYRNDSIQYLFSSATNAILSSLLPNIKLYKVFYPTNKNDGYLWRIPFDDVPVGYGNSTSDFVKNSLDELLAGTGRMHGVGIKSFRYKFVGTNPAEVNTNIEAELELYFQDVRDLVKQITFSKDHGNFDNNPPSNIMIDGEQKEYSFSYADLVVDTSAVDPKNPLKPNPEYFRLQVVAGYAEPPPEVFESLAPDKKDQILKAIRSAKVILYLNPHNHDISFEEDGRVTLKIQYIAAMTSILQSIDALAISPQHEKIQNLQKQFDENAYTQKESIEQIKNDCSLNQKQKDEKVENKQKDIDSALSVQQAELENDKNVLYSSIFRILLGLEGLPSDSGSSPPSIYSATFSEYALGVKPDGVFFDGDVLKDPTQLRILNLNAANGTRSIDDYKVVSITDLNTSYLPLANVPSRTGVTKKGWLGWAGVGEVDGDATKKEAREKLQNDINKGSSDKAGNIESDSKGRFPIQFVFMGDVLDIFCSEIEKIGASDRPRIILSDFQIEIPVGPSGSLAGGLQNVDSVYNTDATYTTFTMNIADIPISLGMLQNFFLEKIIKPGRLTYPLVSLINDLMTDIVIPALSPSVFGRKTVLNKAIRLSTLPVTIPFSGPAGTLDPITGRSKELKFNFTLGDDFLTSLAIHDTAMQNIGNSVANYFIIYCSNQLPATIKDAKGDVDKDTANGIFHFFVGADKGLLKKLSFSRTNTEFYKEAKAQSSSGDKNLGRLREVYDSNITMFGNNVYRAGDYIYIEPLFFIGQEAVDMQTKIGLGGYYQVIDVGVTINENMFETELKTVLAGYIDEKGNVQEAGKPSGGC